VYERTAGVRTLGQKDPITPDTLFLMGSIGKSMTTMMEATLVDAGKLRWDTPVTELLPSFALADEALTHRLVMWNMSCACTGVPSRDYEFVLFVHMTPEQRIASMRPIRPTTGFGETFQYSSLMVAAGGFAAAHAYAPDRSLGDAFEAAMRRNVLDPIGMKSSTLDFDAVRRADHATPHASTVEGATMPVPIAYENFARRDPAGGVWSSVRDMERYVMTELAKGVSPDGKRVVSEANLLERRKPRVRVDEDTSYGLGLNVGTYRDLPMIGHSGGTVGFRTTMFLLPAQGVAVVALTNTSTGDGFTQAFERKVMEVLFEGAKDVAATRVAFVARERRERTASDLARLDRTPDPAWVRGLAGTYANEFLGRVSLGVGPGGGVFEAPAGEWKSAIAQKREDDGTIKVVLVEPPANGLELVVGGTAARPTLTLHDDQITYVLERGEGTKR
jgi:CubicO group peptidase (beta-lactamase class C family)